MTMWTTFSGTVRVYQNQPEEVVVWQRDSVTLHEATTVQNVIQMLRHDASPANVKIVLDIIMPRKTNDNT